MAQNRNKLIQLFIGNISNSVVHEILAKAIGDLNIRKHYSQELRVSFGIAMEYREKINPADAALPEKDARLIKGAIASKVMAELQLRIARGYRGIDINLAETAIDKALRETKVV